MATTEAATVTTEVSQTTERFPETTRSALNPLISQEAMFIFMIAVMDVFCSLVAIFGIVSNTINIIVYVKQGVKDGVTITFIALSAWDLANCALCLITVVCFIISDHFSLRDADILAIQYVYIGYTRGCTYVLSTIVTVYLSIERCICIVVPFKVKEIFTKSRAVYTNIGIVAFGMACFAPAWATQSLQWKKDTSRNITRLVLLVSDNRRQIDIFVDTFNGIVLPTVAQIIITISAFIMISGIKSSAKFRQRAAAAGESQATGAKPTTNNNNREKPRQTDGPGKVMTNKDAKVAQVVVLVAVIFFTCNLPVLMVAYTRPFVPEMDVGKAYYSLYTLVYTIVYAAGLINASVNIFVYYNVSTKFKDVFLSVFCGQTQKSK